MQILKTTFLTGLATMVAMGCANAADGAAKGEWPFSRANAAMTGVSAAELKLPLSLAWQFKTMEKPKGQSEMLVSSAVVRDGKVYAGCKDGKFFCLELTTGKKVW